MFEIDKERFGAFVAQLRKEKGLMQKELAEKLYVSDKAVSKWERGLSIPDVALLVPLAEILGVTVTELLECRRLPKDEPLDPLQTEQIVKKVIVFSEEEQRKYRPDRRKRGIQLLLCAVIGSLEILALVLLGYSMAELAISLMVCMVLMAVFGLYFCVFAKEKLPAFYDENKVNFYSDGIFRMNVPGISFNNRNWPYIIRAAQLWAMIGLVATPVAFYIMTTLFPPAWRPAAVYVLLFAVLGGLFIPMIAIGIKYGSGKGANGDPGQKRKRWLVIAGCAAVIALLLFVYAGGITTSGSGLRVGWVENNTLDNWTARYSFFDGSRRRTVNADGGPTVLVADITTASGDLGLTVADEQGNVLFSQQGIETSTFEIEIPGKVTVKITGDDHKGSFSLSWQ